jgi:UDP-3-O-[3-hydroxymyristoyl] glucosamine N-acyltransferase
VFDPIFFPAALAPTLQDIAEIAGARIDAAIDEWRASGLASLATARPSDVTFCAGPRHARALAACRAGACLVQERDRTSVPAGVRALVVDEPARAFARLAAVLHREALRPAAADLPGLSADARIHPTARLEPGVSVEPGAIVGAYVEIGTGSVIGAHAVVGAQVRIGRDCTIGHHVSLSHAFVGDRVIIHAGTCIGQDGFGFLPGRRNHLKIAQIGRVIIQDDVEIGANTTIDRGALDDTIVGEGTKIDNLVQIAHNVVIGRHCLIAAQVGIAGSTQLGDFVAIGGQAGIAGHLSIGAGVGIAGKSGVLQDVPAGARVGGYPAGSVRRFLRSAAQRTKRQS